MSKIILSYLFKTNLATFRSAIIDDNTDKICRILDIERDYINKEIDSNGNTPLLLAIQHASPLTIRLLLEQGAHPDKPNGVTFHTPLGTIASIEYDDYHSSKAQRTLEMAKILLDHGAYVDKPSLRSYRDEHDKDYDGKETPLMTAVRKRNFPLVKLLIERKANVNAIERQSQIRAIHFAITNGDEVMYDLLENSGALSCSIVTSGDNTLLHWFCYKKENDQNMNLLNKLLDKGCNINAQNDERCTPLMIAAKSNMIETCRILLRNRADIDKHDLHDNQAIDLSIPGSECSKLLLQQIKCSPKIVLNEKPLWIKRIEPTRRATIELFEIEKEQTSNQSISSKCSDDEKEDGEQTNGFLPPSMYPAQKRHSEEFDRKNEHVWEKFLQINPKRRVLKNFYQARARSVDNRNRPLT